MPAIFVETYIRAGIDRVWELTQDPELHQRWDLRFTEISYLPKEEGEPQRFLYKTNIGLGMPIAGEGESVGKQDSEDGTRTSALKFWSDDRRSLILEGSGYWQYEPDGDGVKFRTSYDYKVRYGVLGKLLDLVYRPVIGAATAWSFEAMRLWAERGILPETSVMRMRVHAVARVALALVWIYQGLVPKLLYPNLGELSTTMSAGVGAESAPLVVLLLGIGQVLLGLALLGFWRARWLLAFQAALPVLLPLPFMFLDPSLFAAPFNPTVLAICMVALGAVGFIAARDAPFGANCRRRPPK